MCTPIRPCTHQTLHWAFRRKFERFFDHFYEYDVVVFVTFPTCHLEVLVELLRLDLPQRYIAMVHNPDTLNSSAVANTLAAGNVRLLTIAPHVLRYAESLLKDLQVKVRQHLKP